MNGLGVKYKYTGIIGLNVGVCRVFYFIALV